MSRTRVSATVDVGLLDAARNLRSGVTDPGLIDEALSALLGRHRSDPAGLRRTGLVIPR